MVTRVPDSTSAPALNSGSAVSVLIFLERFFADGGFWLAVGDFASAVSGSSEFASAAGSASELDGGGAG